MLVEAAPEQSSPFVQQPTFPLLSVEQYCPMLQSAPELEQHVWAVGSKQLLPQTDPPSVQVTA